MRMTLTLVWVLLLVGCGGSQTAAPPSPVTIADDAPAPLLLISIDGFRHDYRDRVATPNLDRLASEGVVADGLQHVFPTKTFTTHYTLVTGLYAENHGVVANSMWDPERQESFSLRNRAAVSDPAWYDGEPFWNTVQRHGLKSATFSWPGSEAPVGGSHPNYWLPYDGSVPHADRIAQVFAWLDLPAAERPTFITLYFSEVDSVGHRHGPDSAEVTQAVADIDSDLGLLIEGLEARELFGRMHVLVVSDHGMTEIDPERTIPLDDYLTLGDVRVSDWGPAAQIWAADMDADAIVDALRGAHPRMRVWHRHEMPERYGFRDHPRIADVVAEADLGWMISSRRHIAANVARPLHGMHGWDPEHREMHGIFIGHGPRFRPGPMPTARSVDVYELMAYLLDIEPAPNDGSLASFVEQLDVPAGR